MEVKTVEEKDRSFKFPSLRNLGLFIAGYWGVAFLIVEFALAGLVSLGALAENAVVLGRGSVREIFEIILGVTIGFYFADCVRRLTRFWR